MLEKVGCYVVTLVVLLVKCMVTVLIHTQKLYSYNKNDTFPSFDKNAEYRLNICLRKSSATSVAENKQTFCSLRGRRKKKKKKTFLLEF